MTTLIALSSLSELLVQTVVQEYIRTAGNVVIVTTNPEIVGQMGQIGLRCTLLDSRHEHDWAQHDRCFALEAMKASVLDFDFPDTDLKAYKPLALDRFYFWYEGVAGLLKSEMLMLLQWDKAIVPLDLRDTLPWKVIEESRKRNVGTVVVQTGYMRTQEVCDIVEAGWLNGCTLLVETVEDANWFAPFDFFPVVCMGSVKRVKMTTPEECSSLRRGLGIEPGRKVECVAFDLRDEYHARRYLAGLLASIVPLVWPINGRARQKFPALWKKPATLIDWNCVGAADVLVSFRQAEYTANATVPVRIVDPAGLRGVPQLSPAGGVMQNNSV